MLEAIASHIITDLAMTVLLFGSIALFHIAARGLFIAIDLTQIHP